MATRLQVPAGLLKTGLQKRPSIDAFSLFNQHIEDHIEASIAFALFLVSEREWANTKVPPLTEVELPTFRGTYLTALEINRYHDAARQLLAEYGNTLVEATRKQFVDAALAEYKAAAARGQRGFGRWGIIGALAGAFLGTVFVIVISIVIKYYGIDLIEVYHRLAAH
jgi:hypothetical protein